MSHAEQTTVPIAPPPVVPPPPGAEPDASPSSPSPRSQRFLIRNINWAAYRQINDALGEHHHYRLSYNGKDLELMTKSYGHGFYGRFFVHLIQILTEALGLPLSCAGDMTCDREDVERGIEPDECFYIENEPRVRGKEKLDLTVDPPPDLALEIDLTTDWRRRMGIYAAIRIPEVWCYEGRTETVTIRVLQADGRYAVVERSRCLPLVSAADLTMFVQRRKSEEENSLLKAFREWVREQLRQSESRKATD